MKKVFLLSFILFTILNGKTLGQLRNNSINKPIFVLIEQNNCKYCKKQKKVISSNNINSFIKKNFQELTVNRSRVPIPSRLDTGVSPTILVLDKRGDILIKVRGYQNEEQLMYQLKKSLSIIEQNNSIDYQLK